MNKESPQLIFSTFSSSGNQLTPINTLARKNRSSRKKNTHLHPHKPTKTPNNVERKPFVPEKNSLVDAPI